VAVRLTLSVGALAGLRQQLARAGADENSERALELPAAMVSLAGGHLELAVPATRTHLASAPRVATVRVYDLAPRLVGIPHLYWQGCAASDVATPRVDLALNPGRGCSAALLDGGEVSAVDEVLLAGARMERWRPARWPAELVGAVPQDGRFSRYAGALGGASIHQRLLALRVGRLDGSATSVAFAGAVSACGATVVDLAAETDLVVALARVDVAVCDVTAHTAGHSDQIASAASLLARVVVAFLGDGGVRLILPGDGCLHGTAMEQHCLRLDGPPDGPPDGPRSRFVASYALFLLERVVTGDIDRSRAIEFVFAPAGLVVRSPHPTVCGSCARDPRLPVPKYSSRVNASTWQTSRRT
jgi:hypothetical protein